MGLMKEFIILPSSWRGWSMGSIETLVEWRIIYGIPRGPTGACLNFCSQIRPAVYAFGCYVTIHELLLGIYLIIAVIPLQVGVRKQKIIHLSF